MARKLKKPKNIGKTVAKFGGTEELGKVKFDGHEHEAATAETMSETKLEADTGYGNAVTIRVFTFGMNPEMFKRFFQERGELSKQDIFNSHVKGIEAYLWKDGWKPVIEVEPRISFDMKNKRYSIFVAARPMRGMELGWDHKTLTLSEAING